MHECKIIYPIGVAMTLKNKDGSVYRLRSPNPLMKEQKIWEFRVHNMKWNSEILPDTSELQSIKTDFQIRNSFIDELDQAAAISSQKSNVKIVETPKNIVLEPKSEVNKVVLEPKSEVNKVVEPTKPEIIDNFIPKIFIHCLPAFIDIKIDNVYGDHVQTLKYKSVFSFEGVILDQSDLIFKFWTQADNLTNQILQGSILYPKTTHKRWWKVQDRFEKTGGWVITSYPSDYQPHFDV
jgi:hypothetical protein